MNILLLASHAVAEYDDLRMFTDLGYDVFAPGGYEDPSHSGEGIRPALPNAPQHSVFVARCTEQRVKYGEPGPAIDWAKARLHDDIIDWADAIIVHHFPEQWITGQWERIRHKRIIWRTCGQSDPRLESVMSKYRPEGLEIVRYSPAERRYFERVGAFAGEDALIRFGKYPDDYGPWVGDVEAVGNLTQDLVARGDSCGYPFWQAATEGLPTCPAGKGSEAIGGRGTLSYPDMLDYLRHLRVYLYTGTRPASYTLGLIEAMLSGVPVVPIGPAWWGNGWDGADLYEAHEIVRTSVDDTTDELRFLRANLMWHLGDQAYAGRAGETQRQRAIELFDVATVGPQWQAFLA